MNALSDEDAQTYMDLGVTANDIVRLRFPDASDEEAGYVLWEQTPFPLVQGLHDLVEALADVEQIGVTA